MSRSLRTLVSSLLPVIPVALVALSVGCGSTVLGGGSDGDDGLDGIADDGNDGMHDGPDDSSDGVADDGIDDSSDGDDPPADVTSLAIERDGLVLLQFASFGLSCSEESPALPDCGPVEDYLLEVEMPASYLVPGIVDFSDPSVTMFTQVRGAAESDGQCYAGGGGSGFGSMEIHSVGGDVIDATVFDAIMTMDSSHQAERFSVQRCSGGVDPQPGSSKLGFTLDVDGGGDGDTGTTGPTGGGTEEDRFVIQIANHDAPTCDNPYATPDCPFEAYAVSVSLPRSYVAVGAVIDLSDPTIYIGFSEQGGSSEGDCWGTGGAGETGTGTLSIDAAAAGSMDLFFSGSGHPELEGAHTIVVCE